jgi:predicted kinase
MLILMRGVHGSGKSTRAKELVVELSDEGETLICSADNYMINAEGKYVFNPRLLAQCHKACQLEAREALESGRYGNVIIDNTNTQEWEMEPYKNMAYELGISVMEVLVGSFDEESLKLYAARNVHGCPLENIKKMAQRFER